MVSYRVEELVLDAVRGYSATADAHGRASRKRQIREADEAIERANADLDDTIRQLGELGLLGRPASHEALQKLTTALEDAHSARARLGDRGESNVIGPDEIDKLHDPVKRLAAWRRLITDTVESVTVAPAMTAVGAPVAAGTLAGSTSRSWDSIHRKPPAATSRPSVDTPGRTTRTTLPTVAESDVVVGGVARFGAAQISAAIESCAHTPLAACRLRRSRLTPIGCDLLVRRL